MTENGSRAILLTTFLIVVGVITWQEIKSGQIPRPQRYVGAGVLWALLGLAAPFVSYALSSAFAAGLMVMLLYKTIGNPPPAAESNVGP